MYRIVYTKQAVKDIKNLKSVHLDEKAKKLIEVIKENPFQNPPPYEELLGNLQGVYSRRINIQHRLVYQVYNEPIIAGEIEYNGTPFNFFKYGGIYTGGHNGMRYKIERTGEKPDYVLNVLIWQGPYASTAMKEEDITAKEFEYSEEGRSSAIQWIQDMYDTNIDRWENAPSINQVKSTLE